MEAQVPAQRPNVIVITGDDVGWENVGAYHQGLMYSTTPNLDQLASDGMRFTWARSACSESKTKGRCRRTRCQADILDYTVKFIDKAEKDGKPFFVWMNPTRMHIISHLSPKYQAKLTPDNGWYLEEGVMSQLDDVVGGVLAKLKG